MYGLNNLFAILIGKNKFRLAYTRLAVNRLIDIAVCKRNGKAK